MLSNDAFKTKYQFIFIFTFTEVIAICEVTYLSKVHIECEISFQNTLILLQNIFQHIIINYLLSKDISKF